MTYTWAPSTAILAFEAAATVLVAPTALSSTGYIHDIFDNVLLLIHLHNDIMRREDDRKTMLVVIREMKWCDGCGSKLYQ